MRWIVDYSNSTPPLMIERDRGYVCKIASKRILVETIYIFSRSYDCIDAFRGETYVRSNISRNLLVIGYPVIYFHVYPESYILFS